MLNQDAKLMHILCIYDFSFFIFSELQLYSKKCTRRYFKARDDDLCSKQGSLCTFKIILKTLLKNIFKYIFTHIYICGKIL